MSSASSDLRRRLLRGSLLLLLLLGACSDPYDLPALAASRPPTIRVLLGRRRVQGVLTIRGQAWEIVSTAGRPYARRGREDLEVRVRPGTRSIVLDREDTGATTLRVRPEKGFQVEDTHYAGELVLHLAEGRVRFVNELDVETYVAGVIPNEMAPGATAAAYRAQAVAARTYAWIRLHAAGRTKRVFDVFDDQGSQVYTGRDPRYEVSYIDMVRHAASTAGVVLTWENEPFPAYYSSTCGGHTTEPRTSLLEARAGLEPLRGVKCDFCTTSPRFAWEKTVTDAEIVAGLKARRRPIVEPVHAIEVARRGSGGWAAEVVVTYGPGRKQRRLPGTDFRSALRLDSHRIFAIERHAGGGRWTLRGRGWGHGVGMCQWGAMEMGRRGFSESEILQWYYPGATFAKVY